MRSCDRALVGQMSPRSRFLVQTRFELAIVTLNDAARNTDALQDHCVLEHPHGI